MSIDNPLMLPMVKATLLWTVNDSPKNTLWLFGSMPLGGGTIGTNPCSLNIACG